MKIKKPLRALGAALGVTACILGGAAFLNWQFWGLEVTHTQVPVSGLPQGFEGMRVDFGFSPRRGINGRAAIHTLRSDSLQLDTVFFAVRQGNFYNGVFTGFNDFFHIFQAYGNANRFFMAAINDAGYILFRPDFR